MISSLHRCINSMLAVCAVFVVFFSSTSISRAYHADVRAGSAGPVLYSAGETPAPTTCVLWFVADLNRDGVPAQPLAGQVLGVDDQLLFVDRVDGTLLGDQAGKHQRLNIPVPSEFAQADIYVYLWNVPSPELAGLAGQSFAVRHLGQRPPPALGNADWSVTTPLIANEDYVRSPDADGDGLPDAWESAHFGSAAAAHALANADPDADGMTNLAEWLAGTTPTDRGSALRILSLDRTTGEWRIGFSSVSGKLYRLECCVDLTSSDWQPIAGGGLAIGAGTVTELADPSTGEVQQRFYRVRLLGP